MTNPLGQFASDALDASFIHSSRKRRTIVNGIMPEENVFDRSAALQQTDR
jgi:hypothetical protein